MVKKVTMRDVAKQADVALSTVSQVFNNKPNVSSETRQRVLDAAQLLGYSKTNSSNNGHFPEFSTIGLLTSTSPDGISMLTNTFFSQIVVSIERECRRNHLNLMYANVEVDEKGRTQGMPPMLADNLVDGVIIVGAFLPETITHIYESAGTNIVLIDGYTPEEIAFDSILIDNHQGASCAVSHLIENGHRKIGLIGSNVNDYPSIAQRREAYIQTLERHGIRETFIEESSIQYATAYEATYRLMEKHPEITAIFACNDETAVKAVMAVLQNLGYSVPDDISVIGFDNTDVATQSNPALTTMHVDRELMGILGVQRLIEKSKNSELTPMKSLISTKLVVRDSVKRLVD